MSYERCPSTYVPRDMKNTVRSLAQLKTIASDFHLPTDIRHNQQEWATFRRDVRKSVQKYNTNRNGEQFGRWNNFPCRKRAAMIEHLHKKQPWVQFFEDDWGAEVACQINIDYHNAYSMRSVESKARQGMLNLHSIGHVLFWFHTNSQLVGSQTAQTRVKCFNSLHLIAPLPPGPPLQHLRPIMQQNDVCDAIFIAKKKSSDLLGQRSVLFAFPQLPRRYRPKEGRLGHKNEHEKW